MVAVMSALSTEGLVWAAVLVWAGFIGLAKAQRIMFQSEGAEIFFRLIELHPVE